MIDQRNQFRVWDRTASDLLSLAECPCTECQQESRLKEINIKTMRVIIDGYTENATGVLIVATYLTGAFPDTHASQIDLTSVTDSASMITASLAAVNAYATSQSYDISGGIIWASVSYIPPATQAHVADATGGAVTNLATNYNLVSGILGVANGLNDANTAQNDLSTKFNALVTKFNTVLSKLQAYQILATS